MATPFMNLDLPTPSVTLGPAWASQLNVALTTIDEHDHSNGKGTTVKTAGIEINANLDFNDFTLFGLQSVKLSTLGATLSGPTHAQSLFSYNGDLYFTAGNGTPVQLTTGASIVATPSSVVSVDYTPISASTTTVSSTGTLVLYSINTDAARTINLPAASAVAPGRLFIFKDAGGTPGSSGAEINNITINADGSDSIEGASSYVIKSDSESLMIASNGDTRWLIL